MGRMGSWIGFALAVFILGLGWRVLQDERATFALLVWLGTLGSVVVAGVVIALVLRATQPKRAPSPPQLTDGGWQQMPPAIQVSRAPQLPAPVFHDSYTIDADEVVRR